MLRSTACLLPFSRLEGSRRHRGTAAPCVSTVTKRPGEKKASINTVRAFSMPALPACVPQRPTAAPLRPLDPDICSSPSTWHIPSIWGEISYRFSWSTSKFLFPRKEATLEQHGANLPGGPQNRFFPATSRPHSPFPHLRRPITAPRAPSSTATIPTLHDAALTCWLPSTVTVPSHVLDSRMLSYFSIH